MTARMLILAAAGTLVVAAAVADAAQRTPASPGFTLAGRAAGRLVPGGSLSIDLRLRNRRPFALRVTALTVAVRAASRPGCTPRANFTTRRYRGRPVVVPAKAVRTLSGLRISRRLWPRVVMRDTAARQGACAGALLSLRFAGVARRAR
jgi:hypothetical protein